MVSFSCLDKTEESLTNSKAVAPKCVQKEGHHQALELFRQELAVPAYGLWTVVGGGDWADGRGDKDTIHRVPFYFSTM